jgi:hypothetical protein
VLGRRRTDAALVGGRGELDEEMQARGEAGRMAA